MTIPPQQLQNYFIEKCLFVCKIAGEKVVLWTYHQENIEIVVVFILLCVIFIWLVHLFWDFGSFAVVVTP